MAACATSSCSARPAPSAPRPSTSSGATRTGSASSALGAGGGNVELLAAQALELGVDVVGVARAIAVQDLQLAFYAEAQQRGYATGDFRIPKIVAGPAGDDRARRSGRATWCSTGWSARSGWRRRWPRCAPAARSPWPTRSRWSPAARWSGAVGRGRGRSCRSTRSTRRWPSACAAAPRAEVRRLVLTASGGAVPGPAPRRAGRRHARGGAEAPDLGHGPGRHDQLGDDGQQGRSR